MNRLPMATGLRRAPNWIDLTGKTFGRLTAIRKIASNRLQSRPCAVWECRCDCGKIIEERSDRLRAGTATCCGCNRTAAPPIYPGQKFGALTTLRKGAPKGGMPTWSCRCECGKVYDVRSNHLRSGRVKSCGHGTWRESTTGASVVFVAAKPSRADTDKRRITETEYQRSVTSFFESGFPRAEAERLALLGVIVEGRAA